MTLLVDLHDDHLVVRLTGIDAMTGLRRSIVVPYSDVREVDVRAPEWPNFAGIWGAGLRAPPFVMKGSIGKPLGPWDRFFWQDRRTQQVLYLRLEGHPTYRELHLGVEQAPELAHRIRDRMHH